MKDYTQGVVICGDPFFRAREALRDLGFTLTPVFLEGATHYKLCFLGKKFIRNHTPKMDWWIEDWEKIKESVVDSFDMVLIWEDVLTK